MTMANSATNGAYATHATEVDSNAPAGKGSPTDHARRVDLRVQRTLEAIQNAFRQMVCEMPASEITVKGLAERARIHRKTFYLHYASIEALFEETLETIAQRYFADIDAVPESMPTEEVNRVFFQHVAEQDVFYERLMTAPDYRRFSGRLFSIALQHNRERYNPYSHLSPAEQSIINTFLVSATLDMYRQWVADGKRIPVDEMVSLSSRLLSEGTRSVRRDS